MVITSLRLLSTPLANPPPLPTMVQSIDSPPDPHPPLTAMLLSAADRLRGVFLRKLPGRTAVHRALSSTGIGTTVVHRRCLPVLSTLATSVVPPLSPSLTRWSLTPILPHPSKPATLSSGHWGGKNSLIFRWRPSDHAQKLHFPGPEDAGGPRGSPSCH